MRYYLMLKTNTTKTNVNIQYVYIPSFIKLGFLIKK